MCTSIVLCYVYTVSSFKVKIIEADSNDITECPHDEKRGSGMFGFSFKYV